MAVVNSCLLESSPEFAELLQNAQDFAPNYPSQSRKKHAVARRIIPHSCKNDLHSCHISSTLKLYWWTRTLPIKSEGFGTLGRLVIFAQLGSGRSLLCGLCGIPLSMCPKSRLYQSFSISSVAPVISQRIKENGMSPYPKNSSIKTCNSKSSPFC